MLKVTWIHIMYNAHAFNCNELKIILTFFGESKMKKKE